MSKLSSRGEAWQADWKGRLASELKRRGSASLRAFAENHGCTTYPEIASALDGPFAPIQMMMVIRSEFQAEAKLPDFVADCLFRYLREYTSTPASHARLRERQVVSAIAACGAALGDVNDEAIQGVWRMLKERLLKGWSPAAGDDPVLRKAVSAFAWSSSPQSGGR